jgi:hypothetical protein
MRLRFNIIGYDPCHKKSDLPEVGSYFSIKCSEMSEDLRQTLSVNAEVIDWLETTKKIIALLDGYSEKAIQNILYDVKEFMPYKDKLLGR